ncbi:MAG TPA: efflux RND transporter periplasmic adaptor subunit [Vicinamibacterales bacterium]|nr:efflux RND transporter periplasmic adaptor subunit [Vicinamibacterales bacterium]
MDSSSRLEAAPHVPAAPGPLTGATAPADASRTAAAIIGRKRRRRGRRLLLMGVVVLAVVAAGVFWWQDRQAPIMMYTTVAVTRGSVAKAVTASGTVNPVLTVEVGTYVSGVIQALYCDYNTEVKKGQLCAQIDPRPYQTIVEQDQANLATARAQLAKDQTNLTYTKLTYQRNQDLAKRGVVSQDTYDSAKNAYDQAVSQVQLDQADIAQRKAALDASQVNLGYTRILSPVNGTVISRNVQVGQTVAASFQTPTLFIIGTNLNQMEVDANVSESDIGQVKAGDRASFTVEAYANRPFVGVVTQVRQAPQTVQNVVTYDVVITVPNPGLLLRPGMTATTRIIVDQRDGVLRVPDQALRYTPGGFVGQAGEAAAPAGGGRRAVPQAHLWVLRDGQPTRTPVTFGLDDDTYTEVTQGLKEGDRVIVAEHADGSTTGGARTTSAPRMFRF